MAHNFETNCIDFLHPAAGDRQDQVQVVDHEVQNRADVGGTERERACANGFDIFRIAEVGNSGGEGRIETLDMPDLQDQIAFFGQSDELIGLPRIQAQGFFHQKMRVGLKKLLGQLIMAGSGSGDHGGVDASQKTAVVGEFRAKQFGGHAPSVFGQGIDNGGEFDFRHFGQFLGVKSAQTTRSDNCNFEFFHDAIVFK